jgi:hypothetical protein
MLIAGTNLLRPRSQIPSPSSRLLRLPPKNSVLQLDQPKAVLNTEPLRNYQVPVTVKCLENLRTRTWSDVWRLATHSPTDLRTRRSVTCLSFCLAGGAIAFKSKLQPTVATNSADSEFIAAVLAAKIAKYLRSILIELGFPPSGPTLLYACGPFSSSLVSLHLGQRCFTRIMRIKYDDSSAEKGLTIPDSAGTIVDG